jgi:predicted phosphodiesterase
MKIGILADIHANKFALKNVLEDAKQLNVEHLLILGDTIGYYYWSSDVLNLLSNFKSQIDMIAGNHEIMFKSALENKNSIKQITEKYGSGIKQAIKNLSKQQQKFLNDLPDTKSLHIDGCNILMCHGSPTNKQEYIYPDAPLASLQQCALPSMISFF